MAHHKSLCPGKRSPLAGTIAGAVLLATGAWAQEATLKPVTVTERTAAPQADITGFGDVPLAELPLSATVIDRRQIESAGARRLADLAQFDSSVSDAYNAPGYWDFLSIRGFTLDNRFNYRREGLPISAETTIPLDNKQRIEILKGTSGIQAGTSAPGGLVNYVVKRPGEQALREVRLEATGRASVLAAADLGGRFGADNAFGYRLNVAQERLRPHVRGLDGERSLLAAATDWRLTRDSVLEGEVEWSRKSQASQVGFSLLGGALPQPVDPRINLNNQPWSRPSQFDAVTGTLRFTQALGAGWRWSAQLGSQRLKNDDYTAFPFGCSVEGNFDRYCSDGTFDYYDFRSENERRRLDSASLNLKGKLTTGSVMHELSFGLLTSKTRNRFQNQAFNPVDPTFTGQFPGNVNGTAVVPESSAATLPSTNRDERSVEFSLQDAIQWNPQVTTWLGVRHTRLQRDSVLNDGTLPTSYKQSLSTPWLAVSYKLGAATTVYASHGRGVESEVVPNNPALYSNAGRPLPALKSRQTEIGIKGASPALQWNAALFDISRPLFLDAAGLRQVDGEARHRGLELGAGTQSGPWTLHGGLTLIDAERQGSTLAPALNGRRPVNVPDRVVRASAIYQVGALPGLSLEGRASHEGRRPVLADESVMLPTWTRFDAALRYETKLGGAAATWTVGIDNVANKRYWKESPTQFGHVYLYPGAPRSLRVSLTAAL